MSRIKLINIQMNQFFYEDQVYKIDKKGVKFGLVVENEVSISLKSKGKFFVENRTEKKKFFDFLRLNIASFHKLHNVIIDLTCSTLLFEGS